MKSTAYLLLFVLSLCSKGFAQEKMKLVIPRGHSGAVGELLITKNGQYMLSGGGTSINLYDLKQNKLLKSFELTSEALQFNKVQTKVLITTNTAVHVLQLSDLSLRTIKVEDADMGIFAEDENYIYTAGRKGPFKINLNTAEKAMLFKTAFLELKNVQLAKTGKTVFFGGENMLYAYDIASKVVTNFPVNFLREVLPNGVVFSLGRTGAIGASGTITKIAFYNPTTMQEIMSSNVSSFSFGNYYNKHFWSFDEKKNQLFVAGEEEMIVCDFNTTAINILPKFSIKYVASIATTSNPDIYYLGYGSLNTFLGVQKYSISQNKLLGGLAENIVAPLQLYPAKHNNGFVAATQVDEKIKYFQVSSSAQKVAVHSWGSNDIYRTISNVKKDVNEDASISPDGKWLVAANNYRDILLSDADNPSQTNYLKTIGANYQQHQSIAFTRDSRTMAVFGQNEIQLIDVLSKRNVKTIAVNGTYINTNPQVGDINADGSVLFTTYDVSNTGKHHVTAISSVSGLPLWDKEFDGNISFLKLGEIENNLFVGYKSFTGNTVPVLATLNPQSGDIINTVNFPSRLADVVAMNTKNTMLCTISGQFGDRESIVWDIKTNTKIMSIAENPYLMQFLKNDSLLITSTSDGIKLYDVFSKKELATIIMYANSDEYIIITPDGLFDGTEKAINAMYFVKNKEVIPLISFFETYYTPNLLARILSGQSLPVVQNINELNIRPTIKMLYAEKTRNLGVEDDVATYQNTNGVAIITVSATAPTDKVEEIRLFHNGKIVNLATRGLFVTDETSSAETKKYTINLLPGNNVFKALAINSQRTESKPDEMVVVYANNNNTPTPVSPVVINNSVVDAIDKNATLHLMVVGIDKYQNKTMQLNYAMADARAFKLAIEKVAATVISNIKTYLVYDEEANKAGITGAFSNVQKNAQPQDVFVFYYAGHGVISEKNKEFYLVPNDVTDLKNADAALQQNGIASKLLQQYAIDIPAQKQLFILDACQSAGAFEQLVATDAGQQKNIANVARSTGTHWIAASGSQQFANEFSALGHGAFTYVLLQALNGEAANNKMITVNGLKYFLQVQVPALMKKYNGDAQLPSSYGFGNDFPVEIVK